LRNHGNHLTKKKNFRYSFQFDLIFTIAEMNNNGNFEQLMERFDEEIAVFLASQNRDVAPVEAAREDDGPREGATPRRGQRVRRQRRANLRDVDDEDEEGNGSVRQRGRRRRGTGVYRHLDADDMAAWGLNRRRRRRVGEVGDAGGGDVGVGAGGGEVIEVDLDLVPIIDLAKNPGESAGAGAGAGDEDMCCIAACCQNPPVFTWLRCCRNEEACIHCVEEHIRRRGWACPMCRGDMRA